MILVEGLALINNPLPSEHIRWVGRTATKTSGMGGRRYDLDGSGDVAVTDLLELLSWFGTYCHSAEPTSSSGR